MKKLKLFVDDYVELYGYSIAFTKKHWLGCLIYMIFLVVYVMLMTSEWFYDALHNTSVRIGRLRNRIIHAFKKRKK